ncbi:MAG: DUF4962 domain-containing protein [Bacteroidia bacterium]|nr:DUF4962 domain-containing protein [Bacteroidia bacterium]
MKKFSLIYCILFTFILSGKGETTKTTFTAAQLKSIYLKNNPGLEHPLLFFRASELDMIRKRISDNQPNDIAAIAFSNVKKAADSLLTKPLIESNENAKWVVARENLQVSRDMLARMSNLGFTYLITKDKKYADRAWAEIQKVLAFGTWKSSKRNYELGTSEMCSALAIAYDWFYDALSGGQREAMRIAMHEKGLKEAMTDYDGKTEAFWPSCDHNWNAVCNGGVVMSAIALGTEYPYSFELLERAFVSLEHLYPSIYPDGGWYEGFVYWDYCFRYFSRIIASLESAMGGDLGYCKGRPGIAGTGFYPINSLNPRVGNANFGDCAVRVNFSTPLYSFFARYIPDANKRAQLATLRYLDNKKGEADFYDILWFNPSFVDFNVNNLSQLKIPQDIHLKNIETVTFRNSWDDDEAFVCFHNGKVDVNHGHSDAGNFIFDFQGIRWACELGSESYDIPNRHHFAYRCRTEGHNLFVINPDEYAGQNLKANAPIIAYYSGDEVSYSISDLSEVYNRDALKAQRGVKLFKKEGFFLVRDEIELKNAGTVVWNMHSLNKTINLIGNNTAEIIENGKTMYVKIASPSNARFEISKAIQNEKFPKENIPKLQKNNKDVQKLVIVLPNITKCVIEVQMCSKKEVPQLNSDLMKPLSDWNKL